jgi:hypothetical protein
MAKGGVHRALQGPTGRLPVFRSTQRVPSRHTAAIRAKDEAHSNGTRVPRTHHLFEAEGRDPVWAPAMEQALVDRFHRAEQLLASAGIDGVVAKSECRTSTCRLQVEYPADALEKAKSLGTRHSDPYGFVVKTTGPIAGSSSDELPEPIAVVDGVTMYRKIIFMAFGEEDSDPRNYAAWAAEKHRRFAEYRAKHPESRPMVGLPPPEDR